MGVDHEKEGSKPGATVTPIRPQIQLADTTPFGTPTLPAVDQGTWGVSAGRRMQADEPHESARAPEPGDPEDKRGLGSSAANRGPSAQGNHALGDTRPTIHQWRTHSLGSWRTPASLILIALLGGALALVSTGAHTTSPRAATSTVSGTPQQASRALSSQHRGLATQTTLSRRHATKTNRQRRPRRIDRQPDQTSTRHHGSHHPASSPAKDSHSSPPQTVTYTAPAPAPVASPPQPTQTVTVTSTGEVGSGAQVGASPPTSTQPTAPAGPTGSSALISPGHCSC